MIRRIFTSDGASPHINYVKALSEVYENEIVAGAIDTTTKFALAAANAAIFAGISQNHAEAEDADLAIIEALPNLLIEISCWNSNTGLAATPILYKPYGITNTGRGNIQLDVYITSTYLFLIPIETYVATDGVRVAICRFGQWAGNQATITSVA
jgi:hypothetical protein